MRTNHQDVRSGRLLAVVGSAVMTAALATAAGAQVSGALSPVRAQKIANQTIGSFPVQQNDHFGATFAVGDFNGDGRDDLATGVPDDDGPTTAPVTDGGAFIVAQYFPTTGLDPVKLVRQSAGLDAPEAGDKFGGDYLFEGYPQAKQLASCDFNHDGFDDLAVGIPQDDFGATGTAGAVQVHCGSATGLNGARDLFFYDDDLGGTQETYDNFGEVKVAFGAAGGFDPARSRRFTQSTLPSAGETSQQGDHFGAALAAGDFNRDGCDDLAIGAPEEGIATADGKDGHVTLLMANCTGGFLPGAARGIIAGSQGLPGNVNEHNQNFGWTLAAGDLDGDGHDDLAIGAPYETANGLGDPGA